MKLDAYLALYNEERRATIEKIYLVDRIKAVHNKD